MNTTPKKKKTVFIISDGTGITAETFSHSILAHYEHIYDFKQQREPYITTEDRAQKVSAKINQIAKEEGEPPFAFSTLVTPMITKYIQTSNCIFMDLMAPFVSTIQNKLHIEPRSKVGMTHGDTHSKNYQERIEAINFTLEHDDGQFIYALDEAEVILVGVSRCAKTPTSLYLAMQYGIKVANFPLTPDDFADGMLPSTIYPHKNKLYGLTIDPYRLSEIRQARMPNSSYASIENCKKEIQAAERLMRLEGIPYMSTTNRSIEEITTKLLRDLNIND